MTTFQATQLPATSLFINLHHTRPLHISQCNLIVYSTAINDQNEELIEELPNYNYSEKLYGGQDLEKNINKNLFILLHYIDGLSYADMSSRYKIEPGDVYYFATQIRTILYSFQKIVEFWYEYASKNDDKVDYMWLSFTQTIYKGEMGEVSISPTFRLQNGKGAGSLDSFNEDYSRSKFEVTTQIKFK